VIHLLINRFVGFNHLFYLKTNLSRFLAVQYCLALHCRQIIFYICENKLKMATISEASLATLAVHSMPGLDIGQVERERKEMWRKMFQKYEDLEQNNELTDEVSLEDIDKPETVSNIVKEGLKSNFMQPNTILKQYFLEHADEMDEIATIAGDPLSDEEVLSDDSDDDLLYSGSDVSNIPSEGEVPITPPTSDGSDENDDINIMNNGEEALSETDEDNNDTLVGYDDDDELYSSKPKKESKNIYDSQSGDSIHEPSAKKSRLTSPPSPCNHAVPVTKEALEDIKVDPLVEKEMSCSLVCSQCQLSTFYEALTIRTQFVCDECMAGDHVDCEVEDCSVCMEVGEQITLRRQAEVLGRIKNMVG